MIGARRVVLLGCPPLLASLPRVLWQRDREMRPADRLGPRDAPRPRLCTAVAAVMQARLCTEDPSVRERHTRRNEVTGGWRCVVRFRRLDRGKWVELRAHLHRGSEALSET